MSTSRLGWFHCFIATSWFRKVEHFYGNIFNNFKYIYIHMYIYNQLVVIKKEYFSVVYYSWKLETFWIVKLKKGKKLLIICLQAFTCRFISKSKWWKKWIGCLFQKGLHKIFFYAKFSVLSEDNVWNKAFIDCIPWISHVHEQK